MNQRGAIIEHMLALFELLGPRCLDRSTLDELSTVAVSRELWPNGHQLFQRIRQKTLSAERLHDTTALAQYLFEEACAKTLYNLSGSTASFDADSPYWILPNAVALARHVGVEEEAVVNCVSRRGE